MATAQNRLVLSPPPPHSKARLENLQQELLQPAYFLPILMEQNNFWTLDHIYRLET